MDFCGIPAADRIREHQSVGNGLAVSVACVVVVELELEDEVSMAFLFRCPGFVLQSARGLVVIFFSLGAFL
jgi:hypothetical protein